MYHLKFWFTPSRKGGVGRRKLCEIPKTLTVDGTTISNPMEISNILNNYFSSITSKIKLNISFSHKYFSDFLKNRSNISFFVRFTYKTEIESAISSLDSKKSVGPNHIPTKILKLVKNDIKKMGFTRCKAEQPLRGMELQEKKSTKKITGYRKSV